MKGRAPVFMPRVERRDGGYTAPVSLSTEDAVLFPALVSGFEGYIAFVPAGEGREEAVERFAKSAEKLSAQLFSTTA